MALTNTTAPPAIAFAGHPLTVAFSSSATASAGVITIDTSGGMIQSGESILIYTSFETIRFTASSTPANTNGLADLLEADYAIVQLFTVAVMSGTVVTLTTRQPLNYALAVDASGATCAASVTNAGGRSTQDFALLSVLINDGTAYIPSGFDKQVTIAADGTATFNIQDAFDFQFDGISSLTGFTPWRSINTAKQYKVIHTQRTGSTIEPFGELSPRVALYGRWANNFLGSTIDGSQFQTLAPRLRSVPRSLPLYLLWVNVETLDSAELVISATAADGSGSLITKAITLPSQYQAWNYPVGYDQLALGDDAGAPFVRWDVRLKYVVGGITNYSETMTFVVDDAIYETETVLLAYNSRGGVDTFHLTGDLEETTEHSRRERSRYEADGRTLAEAFDHRVATKYTVHTGYFEDKAAFDHLDELLNSERVYWLKDGALVEIFIEQTEMEKGSTTASLFSATIDFRLAAPDLAPNSSNLTPVT